MKKSNTKPFTSAPLSSGEEEFHESLNKVHGVYLKRINECV